MLLNSKNRKREKMKSNEITIEDVKNLFKNEKDFLFWYNDTKKNTYFNLKTKEKNK